MLTSRTFERVWGTVFDLTTQAEPSPPSPENLKIGAKTRFYFTEFLKEKHHCLKASIVKEISSKWAEFLRVVNINLGVARGEHSWPESQTRLVHLCVYWRGRLGDRCRLKTPLQTP